ICVRGLQASCGSKILGSYHPPYDATVTERLRNAGMIIVGKTNCDEFAMGSSNENSAFGPVRNPWNTDYVPGGSSGGSAAAVAAGMVPVALGSDTGGSIRQPAALCGVVGIKPTYGRVSRYGLVAFGSSLDQIGVFARNTEDAARVLGVIAGHDTRDATTAEIEVPDYVAEFTAPVTGLRLGIPRALFGEGLDGEVRSSVEAAIEVYRKLGVRIVDVELPHTKYSIAAYYIIATAEASSNLARFDGVRYGYRSKNASTLSEMYCRTRDEGFGAEVKRRIMLGTFVLSSGYYDAYYRKGQQVRTLNREDFKRAFELCDAIVTPTSPSPAFKFGQKTDDPLAMYLCDIYTVSMNLAGIPGVSIPCGLTSEGLPIGMQLVGPHWTEGRLLRLGNVYAQAAPFDLRPAQNRADQISV
ncbi:MAG: Asp-tRNA(Asn)/Glu-tRNA(Gln) amidotransferase subunit GatA, partial [Pyrinomonadaceae bacterium]